MRKVCETWEGKSMGKVRLLGSLRGSVRSGVKVSDARRGETVAKEHERK